MIIILKWSEVPSEWNLKPYCPAFNYVLVFIMIYRGGRRRSRARSRDSLPASFVSSRNQKYQQICLHQNNEYLVLLINKNMNKNFWLEPFLYLELSLSNNNTICKSVLSDIFRDYIILKNVSFVDVDMMIANYLLWITFPTKCNFWRVICKGID